MGCRMRILITGANRGLGLQLAKVGLERGHEIIASLRDFNQKGELESIQQHNSNLTLIKMDVSNDQSVSDAKLEFDQHFSSLDVIMNNAAILLERDQNIEELSFESVLKSLDVNTVGPMRVVQAFLDSLRAGSNQQIINISSEAGSLTHSYSPDYSYGISKAALNMFSEKLNVYLRKENILVYSIHPGWMKTDMGGTKAPLNPYETACHLFDLLEKKKKIEKQDFIFMDYNGAAMDI